MNRQSMPARRRIPRIPGLYLACALLIVGALLGLSLLHASAATQLVTYDQATGTYRTEGGVQVYRFEDVADVGDLNGAWMVQSLTVDGNGYQDADQNWYYPSNGSPLSLTLKAVDSDGTGALAAPFAVEGAEVVSCSMGADGTLLSLTMADPGAYGPALSVESVLASGLPDGAGVVQDQNDTLDGYYYQPDGQGLFVHLPWLTLEHCTLPGVDLGLTYGDDQVTDYKWSCYIVPGTIEFKLAEHYAFNSTSADDMDIQILTDLYVEGPGYQSEFVDERTFRLTLDDWTGVLGLHIYSLSSSMTGGSQVTVTPDGEGGYVGADGTQVYPIQQDLGDWTLIVAGTIYQDGDGNNYAPEGTVDAIALQKDGLWLPTSYAEGADLPTGTSFTGGQTTLSYPAASLQANEATGVMESGVPSPPLTEVQAQGEPVDSVGAVQSTDGTWYYFTSQGTFAPMPQLTVTVNNPSADLGLEYPSGELYGTSSGQGTLTGYTVLDYMQTVQLTGGYTVSNITVEPAEFQDSVEWDLDKITLSFYGTTPPQELTLTVDVSKAVTLTFSPSQVYTVWSSGNDSSSENYLWTLGEDFPFELRLNEGYYDYDTDASIQVLSCTVSTLDQPLTPEEIGYDAQYWTGTIPGEVLTADCTITFEVEVTGVTSLIGVEPVSGPGYRLFSHFGAQPGPVGEYSDNIITALLFVEADYDQSTPQLGLPDGYSAQLHLRADRNWVSVDGIDGYLETYRDELDKGTIIYVYEIAPDSGVFPESTDNLIVTVSGIEPNETSNPPAGGGGGGSDDGSLPSKPTIRVENQLNEENASSDTRLWPMGTVEKDGVSITTVTDEELEALIDLAQKHAEDVEQLEGDGYKEGIIVIEDLSEDSNIHTYILQLIDFQFQRISEEEWDRFTVQTPAGSLSLYGGSIQEVAALDGAVDFTISRLEHEGRPGVDVTLTAGGKPVTLFTETYGVRTFVPYVPTQDEDGNALLMEYIHDDNSTVERVAESFYDPAAGGVYVFTSHLSKFGVAYRPAVFSDVGADHWANPYVTFLAARGLLDSEGGTYRPDDTATRGELIQLLAQALSAAKLPAQPVQVYSDVPATSSLALASNWVYYNNLAGAITSGGTLRPNAAITREDMAALLGNTASGVGLRLRSKGLDTGYTDLDSVADYARQSVIRLRAAGVLEMTQNYKFNPDATLNRGEMAQIVASLLSNL